MIETNGLVRSKFTQTPPCGGTTMIDLPRSRLVEIIWGNLGRAAARKIAIAVGATVAMAIFSLASSVVLKPSPNTKPLKLPGDSKRREIESMLQAAQSRGQLNGSVLVSEKGEVIYSKGFGYADFEKRTPVSPNTTFELASLSKPFTALAIMMLKERGKLSYDDNLTKYFPELPYPGVTIRQMLTHTSGLPSVEPLFSGSPADKISTNADVVAKLQVLKPPPFFAPGEKWQYNPTGYFLLARIVEDISGISYGQFLEASIFRPLGMKDSLVFSRINKGKIRDLAKGYMRPTMWSDEYALSETLPRYSYILGFGETAGAKGVGSSAQDLFMWIQALSAGDLVHKDTLEEAYTPVRLNDGSTPSAGGGAGNGVPSHSGFGWFIEQGPDGKTVRHTGDWPGYITCLIHNLDKDQTIVVLTNVGDFSAIEIANGLENILNDHPYSLPKISIGRAIGKTLIASGVETAVTQYHDLRENRSDDYDFDNQGELNTLGYQLLSLGKKKEAIEVFKLNVEAFPKSWVVFDSLGEAYLANGENELAMKNYRRSVELNPQNRGGIEALKRLEVR
jgi:CubicO group peptidase (beta-lactamase class C family)